MIEDRYAELRVNKGKPCNCPARILSQRLVGTECEVCTGIIPPLDPEQLRLLAYEEERADKLAQAQLKRWRNGRK